MSQLERLQEERSRGRGNRAPRREKGIVNYQPTVPQKKLLKEGGFTWEQAVGTLENRLAQGLRLTLSHNDYGDCVSVIVRDASLPFGEGVAVAVNHSNLERAILVMGYYLSEVNPGYPDLGTAPLQLDFDY